MIVHGTAVALSGRGVLITGPSGAGKSALALQLMAFGAQLVADDRVMILREGESLIASAPDAIRGLIEARGVGILSADPCTARLVLAVDLSQIEDTRLPPMRHSFVHGLPLPLVLGQDAPHLPAAILQYLKAGRHS